MNYKQNSYEKTERYKKVPLHFSMVTSTFPNFSRLRQENLESTLRANNANCIIWDKILQMVFFLYDIMLKKEDRYGRARDRGS